MSRVLRPVHLCLGLVTALFAVVHLVTSIASREGIKPYSSIGWFSEQLLMSATMFLGGVWMVASSRRMRNGQLPQSLLSAVFVGIVSLAWFRRYFTPQLGLLATAAFIDGLLLSLRLWPNRTKSVWPVATALPFAAMSILSIGLLVPSLRSIRQSSQAPKHRIESKSVASAIGDDICRSAAAKLNSWAREGDEGTALEQGLDAAADSFGETLVPIYCRLLLENLERKEQLRQDGLRFSANDIANTSIAFERFRLESYLSSGVVPKRYFGFFDNQGDTAQEERLLRETIASAVPAINVYAERSGSTVRISEMEVAVTFLAEGGAWLLTDGQDELERIHPVRGIGLDSFRDGFNQHRELVGALDKTFGTKLGELVWPIGNRRVLVRPMTFREAILGTAVMYLFEKQLTADLLTQREPRQHLEDIPLDRQFVFSSLVYNSGLLFANERIDQILQFSTGAYLADVNVKNQGKRPTLPLFPPDQARKRLLAGDPLPTQLTSWNAVYHVLQRYGAWVALKRYSTVFDDQGKFRN